MRTGGLVWRVRGHLNTHVHRKPVPPHVGKGILCHRDGNHLPPLCSLVVSLVRRGVILALVLRRVIHSRTFRIIGPKFYVAPVLPKDLLFFQHKYY